MRNVFIGVALMFACATPQLASAQSAFVSAPRLSGTDLDLFAGLDGSKQPQDLGINANMGIRLSGNLGVPISRRAGLGLQIGAGMNVSDAAVHVLDQIEGTSRRTQTFLTAGLFQQTGRLSWALAYDLLHEKYYDGFMLGQLRGRVGYALQRADELGVWFTESTKNDEGVMGDTAVRLSPISQVNGYVRHTWPTAARTTIWAGVASHHSNIVWVLPDNSRDRHVLVYGGEVELPLSDRVSVTGSANLLTPASTGTVDAFLGLSFYPTRGALHLARPRFAAPLAVANNPTFAVDLNR